jgi:hypothetical protein
MKKMIFVFAILLFSLELAWGFQTEITLAWFPRAGYDASLKQEIFKKQVLPINEAFSLNADLTELEKSVQMQDMPADRPNSLNVYFRTLEPTASTEYSILRDGKEINQIGQTLEEGDTVRFTPKLDIQSDWIEPGAAVDSPPIEFLERTEYNSLKDSLLQEFQEKYPCGSTSGSGGGKKVCFLTPENVKNFSTQSSPFTEKANYYVADNGYNAYLVPVFGNTKAGIQFFALAEPIEAAGGYYFDCKTVGQTIECTAKKEGSSSVSSTWSFASFLYVDKIIKDGQAKDAGWIGINLANMTANEKFQILPKGKHAPTADFTCTEGPVTDDWGPARKTFECDASASSDPDGEIAKYEYWGGSPVFYEKGVSGVTPKTNFKDPVIKLVMYCGYSGIGCPSTAYITIKVTDNEGYMGEKTKVFDLQGSKITEITPAATALEFTADYQNQKALLTLKNCPSGTTQTDIDIDLLGADGNPANSVLEKQPIQCEQTTEVSGITAPGTYQATATIGGEEKQAIFTVG